MAKQTYTIEIDEVQRCQLFFAICRLPETEKDQAFKELALMLADLPNIEKKTPGIIHGLCW